MRAKTGNNIEATNAVDIMHYVGEVGLGEVLDFRWEEFRIMDRSFFNVQFLSLDIKDETKRRVLRENAIEFLGL